MLKLVVLVAMLAGAAAAAAWLPLHGRTVLERWRAAPGPIEFVERGWAEARVALDRPRDAPRATPPQAARVPKAAPRPARPARPSEMHTDEDRAALDRILAEHAGR